MREIGCTQWFVAVTLVAFCLPVRADAFDDALQDVQLGVATPEIVVQFCASRYPGLAESMHAGFVLWQRRHADLIFEIETRGEQAMRQKSLRDKDRYEELAKAHDALLASYRKGYQADLARMPEAEQRKGCARYGEDLNGGAVNVSDLEKMLAKPLEQIRKRDDDRRRGR